MIFKWLKAKNFLSIGEEGIHIQFDKLGNIVLVKGQNLDVNDQASNGAGKSTLIECLVYGLFGKLIKGLPHKEAINKKTKKNLEIEICFELDGHEYIVHRCRKPDKLTLSKDGEDITLGGMPSTQQEIENIVRLNYESFVNIVCFGEHNNHAFLACDAQTKRSIVENLLGLEKYLKYCKTAKEDRKTLENKVNASKREYSTFIDHRQSASERVSQIIVKQNEWKRSKKNELEFLLKTYGEKEKELSNTDDGNAILLYEQAQERIRTNKDEVIKYESKRNEIASLVEEVQVKQNNLQDLRNELNIKVREDEHQINTKNAELRLLEEENKKLVALKPGVKCNVCFGVVDPNNYQNYILNNSNQRASIKDSLTNLQVSSKDSKTKFAEVEAKLTKIRDTKKQADEKLLQITNKIKQLIDSIQKDSKLSAPQTGAKELVIKEQIEELKRKIVSKKDELENHDPYIDIINQTKSEIDNLVLKIEETKAKIDEDEALIPYYEYWAFGFGDDGIRAYIIDDILPALNARINYWLQFLIDNKLQLSFDNKFEVVIQRNPIDGDPFVYNATSGGERRRINLAISQAFAHVMMISSGTCPSIISLDEVALNVDVPGVHGIYKMIGELARDRQVFVTTHDPNLADLLNSCDVITVVKENGFSTIKNDQTLPASMLLSCAAEEA
jgi:DNA repair exonuclease SbcCD ATPase subunit